jgi:hypothetical protein
LGHAAGDAKKEELRSSPQILYTSQCGVGGSDRTPVAAFLVFYIFLCLLFAFSSPFSISFFYFF